MDEKLKILIKEVFSLVLEVNTTTEYKASFDIKPVFDTDQIWYIVTDNEGSWGCNKTIFTNDIKESLNKLKAFKKKLENILLIQNI